MSYLHTRHFSIDEANNLLDEIKPLIEQIISLKKKLDAKGYDVYNHQYFGGYGPNGQGVFPEEMERLIELIKKISAEGILIKSIDNGLIDFPHLRKTDEEVYLCWKFDEGEIAYWHSIPEGFPGRRNISEL